MKQVVSGRHKVEVEIKAERLADKGWKIIGAPYFSDQYDGWVYEVERPKNKDFGSNE